MALFRCGGGAKLPDKIVNSLYGTYSGGTIIDFGKVRHITGAIIGGRGLSNDNYNYMYYSASDPTVTTSNYAVRVIGGSYGNTNWYAGKSDNLNINARYIRMTHVSGNNLFIGVTFDDE